MTLTWTLTIEPGPPARRSCMATGLERFTLCGSPAVGMIDRFGEPRCQQHGRGIRLLPLPSETRKIIAAFEKDGSNFAFESERPEGLIDLIALSGIVQNVREAMELGAEIRRVWHTARWRKPKRIS